MSKPLIGPGKYGETITINAVSWSKLVKFHLFSFTAIFVDNKNYVAIYGVTILDLIWALECTAYAHCNCRVMMNIVQHQCQHASMVARGVCMVAMQWRSQGWTWTGTCPSNSLKSRSIYSNRTVIGL